MERRVIKFTHANGVKLDQPIVFCECGKPITNKEWMVTDAQHAALSVGGSVEPCWNCIRAIIDKLEQEL